MNFLETFGCCWHPLLPRATSAGGEVIRRLRRLIAIKSKLNPWAT